MGKTQNPLQDVALLRLYVYLTTTQSAVSRPANHIYCRDVPPERLYEGCNVSINVN
jgi:hypothetical protein